MNIKTYIKGIFGKTYSISKELIKDTGDIFRREPKEFEDALNMGIELSESEREKEINRMFDLFLAPYANIMLEKEQIVKKFQEGSKEFYLLPAVKKELGID